MKKLLLFVCAVQALAFYACKSVSPVTDTHNHAAPAQVVSDTAKGSIKRTAMANIADAHVHIDYYSPAVRKRQIWGGLVAYDEIWVTGAHSATAISFSEDVRIQNTKITKGKYALFTIPGRENWVVVLNKNWEQHLTDEYSAQEDVLRFTVKPQANAHTERLTYEVLPLSAKKGKITMAWDALKLSFDIER